MIRLDDVRTLAVASERLGARAAEEPPLGVDQRPCWPASAQLEENRLRVNNVRKQLLRGLPRRTDAGEEVLEFADQPRWKSVVSHMLGDRAADGETGASARD